MKYSLITETFPPEINGVSMTLGKLVEALLNNSIDVELISPARKDRKITLKGMTSVSVKGFKIPKYPELRFGFPAVGKIKKIWQNSPPDIVHIATEGPLGWAASYAAKSLNIPYISSYHTNFHEYGVHYGFGVVHRIVLAWLRNFHNNGVLTFAPSQDLIDKLSETGFKNLRLLSRGIDTELFNPSKRSHKLRSTWGATKDTPVAIYVGRLAGEKNIPLTIQSWEKMKAISPETKLVIVGDGPMRSDLEKKYPEIIFAGTQTGESLARHYASADCFPFGSTTETFGNVVTEAMASGLVVLAFDYAAPAKFIKSGENGFLAPYDDKEAFLNLAEDMIKKNQSWSDIRQKATESTHGHSWNALFSSFLDDLKPVLISKSKT